MHRLLACTVLSLGLTSSSLLAEDPAPRLETATIGAGCFWCVEAVYLQLPGIVAVVSGYAGGREPNPTYAEVSSGRTSHAEVVQITYDANLTTYEELLAVFWSTHDPTDPRGVWPDFGPHYRSIILAHNDEQLAAARASRDAQAATLGKKIATEIAPLRRFYRAESYHQDYARKNPNDRYVHNIIVPKLRKLGLPAPAAAAPPAQETRP
jgi:peptide-methionine (S)-S-oxide reductase